MSFAHVLELDSQAELLDRLGLLTNFGSNLIAVNGQSGGGKSWLAQRYLEIGATNKNQCLLLCHSKQDDAQRRMLILSQIFSDALFNQQDTLLDSLERILGSEACDIVIVVDDSHLLSDTLILELWVLVLAAQANSKWKINILLFTKSGCLESVLTRVSYGQELKPVELDIEMLSEIEARRFFESLVIRYVSDESEKRVRDAFKKVAPIPGDIMALGEIKVEKRIIIRSIVGSPLNIALVVLMLLLLAAGGYWWMYNQPSPDDKAQKITNTVEQTALPVLSEPKLQTSSADPTIEKKPDSTNSVDLANATDDSSSLPPAVTDEVASVGKEDKQQRVVIESDVVDALLEGKSEEVGTDGIKQVAETSAPQVQSSASSSLINVVKTSEQSAAATSSKSTVKFSFSRDELRALSPDAYTLQLGAMTTMEDVQAFLDKYDLNGKVRIYSTVRSGTEWYIITYQDYPTIQQARDAVESLSESLRAVSPWAKSMSQVHREIEQVK